MTVSVKKDENANTEVDKLMVRLSSMRKTKIKRNYINIIKIHSRKAYIFEDDCRLFVRISKRTQHSLSSLRA